MAYALREFEHRWRHYRKLWRGSIVISVANPLLFLIAIGAGLGALIAPDPSRLGGVEYLAFFAPGMLAAASMQNGIVESAFPVSRSTMTDGSYRVAVSTPLEPNDVLYGHTLFMALRIAMSAAAFIVVMVAMGAAQSPLVVLTLPAALLTGLAFATPVSAWAVTLDSPQKVMGLFKWVVMPLYLFSGTFFPVEQMGDVLKWVAYATPLWHGVDLCRSLSLGTATWPLTAVHLTYLVALAGLGLVLARRTYPRSLHS
jgi:lipooligosaccharide transport system permease protein